MVVEAQQVLKREVNFRDKLKGASISALSLNPTGSLAMLGGQNHLWLLDTNRTLEGDADDQVVLAKARRPPVGPVQETQFSFGPDDTLCAVASDNYVYLYTWGQAGDPVQLSILEGHARNVMDLSWHEQQHNLLASCADESTVLIWDMRSSNSRGHPEHTLTAHIESCKQVCWERIRGQHLAVSCGRSILTWDVRLMKRPYTQIERAHEGTILAMDFSTVQHGDLVTSDDQNTVKFWDISDGGRQTYGPRRELPTNTNILKMRYTPFGYGLVTLEGSSGSESGNSMRIWHANNLNHSVYTFFGHHGLITEFCWRNMDPDKNRLNYELVSWCKDAMIRIWTMNDYTTSLCGVAEGADQDVLMADVTTEDVEEEEDSGHGNSRASGASSVEDKRQFFVRQDTEPAIDALEEEREEEAKRAAASRPASAMRQHENGDGIRHQLSRSSSLPMDRDESEEEDSGMTRAASDAGREESAGVAVASGASAATSVHGGSSEFSTPKKGVGVAHDTLLQEFRSVRVSKDVTVMRKDILMRRCIIKATTTVKVAYILTSFPADYPKKAPEFFFKDMSFDDELNKEILTNLKAVASLHADQGLGCLDACVKELEQIIRPVIEKEIKEAPSEDTVSDIMGSNDDSKVPFQPPFGARFSPCGQLVFFDSNEPIVERFKTGKLPRSISASYYGEDLAQFGSLPKSRKTSDRASISAAAAYRRSKSKGHSIGSSISEDPARSLIMSMYEPKDVERMVYVLKVDKTLPSMLHLANEYRLTGFPSEVLSAYNAIIAFAKHKNADGANTWRCLKVLCQTLAKVQANPTPDLTVEDVWSSHGMGAPVLFSRVRSHAYNRDVQTAALVACAMADLVRHLRKAASPTTELRLEIAKKKSVQEFKKSDKSPHMTRSSTMNTLAVPQQQQQLQRLSPNFRRARSSQSESGTPVGDYFVDTGRDHAMEAVTYQHNQTMPMPTISDVDDTTEEEDEEGKSCNEDEKEEEFGFSCESDVVDLELVKKTYAELLHRTGRLLKSAEIRKRMKNDEEKMQLHVFSPTFDTIQKKLSATSLPRQTSQSCPRCSARQSRFSYAGITANSVSGGTPAKTLCRQCRVAAANVEQSSSKDTKASDVLKCVFCDHRVRGLALTCGRCGHGGHLRHVRLWFGGSGGDEAAGRLCPVAECKCQCSARFFGTATASLYSSPSTHSLSHLVSSSSGNSSLAASFMQDP